jgi:probable phosphoglycerate mutase
LSSRLVYLVRHGETEGQSSIRFHGSNDVALSELGRRQVGRLVPRLRDVRFAAAVHSPLRRAVTSAEVLLLGLAVRPRVVESHAGLAEIDFGEIEGWTEAEIAERRPEWHRAWKAGRVDGFPGGDSFAGFTGRIVAAWEEIAARHPSGDLLVVAHRGVVKRILMHGLGMTEEQGARLDIGLASLSVLRCGAENELVEVGMIPDEA